MHPSVLEFEARVRRTPAVLAETLARPAPSFALRAGASVLLTGIGTSDGVARFAEAAFRHALRVRVTRLPLSSFVADDVKPQGQVLLVVSQELSPNARLALNRVREFEQACLFTSLPESDPRLDEFRAAGGVVWSLPPAEERGFLVRVMGPPAAALAIARLGGVPGLDAVPAAVEGAIARGFELAKAWPAGQLRAPLVATGWYASALELLAWTWMESLWVEAPPVWDALQVAHGPWQQRFGVEGPWLLLSRPDDVPHLFERLEQMAPMGQPMLHAPATLPAPLAFFEHLATVQALAAGLLLRDPRDLTRWPGQGTDGPLYELGR
jgi:hypothetical protein